MKYFPLLICLFASQLHAQTFTKTNQSIVKDFADWEETVAADAYIDNQINIALFSGSSNAETVYLYNEQEMLNIAQPFSVSCDILLKTLGTKNYFGIVIGDAGNKYSGSYFFNITSKGEYKIEQTGERGVTTKKILRINNAIKHNEDAVNNLKVTYTPSEKNLKAYYSFYCNNVLLDTLSPSLRVTEYTGIGHGGDGEVHFKNFNLAQEKYDIIEKTTSLKDGLTTIENAAEIGFWPFKKRLLSNFKYESSFLLNGSTTILTDFDLEYKYGPYETIQLAEAKREELTREVMNIRKPYLLDKSNLGTTYFSKNTKSGYSDPHIFIYLPSIKKQKANEKIFVTLRFVPTKSLRPFTLITQPAKTNSELYKSFFKIWTAAKQTTAFDGLLGERMDPKSSSTIKSTSTIDGTSDNVIQTESYSSGTYYRAKIISGVDKETAFRMQNEWLQKLIEIFGKGYAYNEKEYIKNNNPESKYITFTKALPILNEEKSTEAQLIVERNKDGKMYDLKLQIVSFPQK